MILIEYESTFSRHFDIDGDEENNKIYSNLMAL